MTTTRRRFVAVLNIVTMTALGLALFVGATTYDAPQGRFTASPEARAEWAASLPQNVPTFTAADKAAHPECHAVTGGLVERVLVVREDASRVVLPFAVAWDMIHDAGATPVLWVIGACK